MDNRQKERILIADDHGIVRLGLSLIIKKLRPKGTIHEVNDYRSVIEIISRQPFDLIILDINMPNGNFQETLELIKAKHPKVKVLVFSSQDERVFAHRYLKMGADGFLHKLASEEVINKALQKMLDKGRYISEEVKESLIFNALNKQLPQRAPLELLSDREMEIAEKLQKGMTLKNISNELNIHVSTVSTYKNRIFKKLDIQSVPELIEVFRFHAKKSS